MLKWIVFAVFGIIVAFVGFDFFNSVEMVVTNPNKQLVTAELEILHDVHRARWVDSYSTIAIEVMGGSPTDATMAIAYCNDLKTKAERPEKIIIVKSIDDPTTIISEAICR
jgi:hypothetical protein